MPFNPFEMNRIKEVLEEKGIRRSSITAFCFANHNQKGI